MIAPGRKREMIAVGGLLRGRRRLVVVAGLDPRQEVRVALRGDDLLRVRVGRAERRADALERERRADRVEHRLVVPHLLDLGRVRERVHVGVVVGVREQHVALGDREALDLRVGLGAHAEVEEVAVHLLVAEVLQRARAVVGRAVVERERDAVGARVVDLMIDAPCRPATASPRTRSSPSRTATARSRSATDVTCATNASCEANGSASQILSSTRAAVGPLDVQARPSRSRAPAARTAPSPTPPTRSRTRR